MNQETLIPVPVPKQTLKEKAVIVWSKFYSNKKIFWPTVSLFSIIVLIIVAGLIFRLVKGGRADSSISPTPTAVSEVPAGEEKEKSLDIAKEELTDLEKQIKELDLVQKRLTPPVTDFKVDF